MKDTEEACASYPVSIFIAGDEKLTRMICREFCDKEPTP